MTKILLLNASPSGADSDSGIFLYYLKIFIEENSSKCNVETLNYYNHRDIIEKIFKVDKVILAFPTYAGTPPSTVLELFSSIESHKHMYTGLSPNLYAIINSNFINESKADICTQILKVFCKSVGFDYGFTLKIPCSPLIINSPFKSLVIKSIEKMELMIYLDSYNNNISTRIPLPNWLLIKLVNGYFINLGKFNGLTKKDMEKPI